MVEMNIYQPISWEEHQRELDPTEVSRFTFSKKACLMSSANQGEESFSSSQQFRSWGLCVGRMSYLGSF